MNRITFFERQIIASGLRVGKSVRSIAKSINRDHRVVQREANRNKASYEPYTAVSAQRLADAREKKRNKPKLEKYENYDLRQYIIKQLRDDLSPEQITGMLHKQAQPELSGKAVCHETIYQYIYRGEGRYESLFQHLRQGRKKRFKRWSRKPRKITIPERISIHERSNEIEAKLTIGHWESDTIEGKRNTRGNLSVQYERKIHLLRLHKIANKEAPETENAIRRSIDSLPLTVWKSITFDNGGEAASHVNLRNDFSIDTFFCDAYASWQKGGVENINGLIRQYVPKGTDISNLTEDYIYSIQEKLNNRPRKSLNYLSPNQVLAREVGH